MRIKNPDRVKEITPLYGNYAETSKYTSIPIKTLQYYVSQGRIPFLKIGGSIKFSFNQIDEWMQGQSVPVSLEKACERGRLSNY